MGSHSLHQGIFPTQGSNPSLPHCRQILNHLSQQGSPKHRPSCKKLHFEASNGWAGRRVTGAEWEGLVGGQSKVGGACRVGGAGAWAGQSGWGMQSGLETHLESNSSPQTSLGPSGPLTLPQGFGGEGMAPHSSTLAWKIPWTEEPGRLQSMGSLRVGHD